MFSSFIEFYFIMNFIRNIEHLNWFKSTSKHCRLKVMRNLHNCLQYKFFHNFLFEKKNLDIVTSFSQEFCDYVVAMR